MRVIIKGDVQGSVETLSKTVTDANTDEVKVRVIHSAVGAINVWWFQQPTFDPPRARLDLNTATVRELATLPGIDLSTAARMVSARPYTGPEDLVQKSILTPTTYERIKDQIEATPP